MNKLSVSERARILQMMVEGMSIQSITRMTGASKNTVAKLLVEAGNALADYQDKTLRNLPCKRVQCDEIWSFVYAKQKNAPEAMKAAGEAGDVWTWTALCADTKLIVTWHLGHHYAADAKAIMDDLASRLTNRVQLTTDSLNQYLNAVEGAFGRDVDYGMLIKKYGQPEGAGNERRYSQPVVTGIIKNTIKGAPDKAHISTSYVERANLSMRMGMRRFTRLTNGFSKKFENHGHAIAIYFMHYNFGRVHKTLCVTPAMEAGIAKSPMSFEEMIAIVDAAAPPPKPRGPYKPRAKKEISN